ncbi:MAG: hypothetical protein ACK5LE_03200 [Alphaproteobacteria bacterium]
MTTPYNNEDGPWGSNESGPWGTAETNKDQPAAPHRSIPTAPSDNKQKWLYILFSFNGELNRIGYLIAIIIPLLILAPYTILTAQYFMENAEILQQKNTELGFWGAIAYMLNQMVAGLSGIKLWLYNAFTILQYVAYWILMVATVKRFKNAGLMGAAPWVAAITGIIFVFPITIIIALALPSKNKRA